MMVKNSFEDEIIIRNDTIDNVDQWYWLKQDEGAWDGPKKDWIESHSKNYFQNVRKFDTVVQAGGCLGMYPRLLSDMFSHVYTFEPDPLNFYCLNLNCQKKNIVKFNCALGSRHRMVSMNRPFNDNVGCNQIKESSEEKIPVLRLDDLELESCDMICLDVESYEIDILAGAGATIVQHFPVIVCENGNDRIHDYLRAFGYEIQGTSVADTIYIPKEKQFGEDIL